VKRDIALDSTESILIDGLFTVAKKVKDDPMDTDAIVQVIRYLDAIERLRKINPKQHQ
ncbi:hypothetical protein HLB03_07575, partial [Acidianus sp. DSM 29099]|nr:hypothetical protein [Acidianus sp. RZ1]